MQGLSVYNDDMQLQIDSDYIDVSLQHKKRLGVESSAYVDSDFITAFGIDDGGTILPIKYSGQGDLYVFNSSPAIPTESGFGLELYGADGSVYFSSKNKSIKVIDLVSISKSQLGPSFSWSKSYQNKVALLPMSIPIRLSMGAQQIVYFYSVAFNRNGNSVAANWALYANRPYHSGEDDMLYLSKASNLEFLVIDVTGY